jgi:hypothetical protein
MMEAAELRSLLVDSLQAQFGAQRRRSWGHEALYSRGRLFVLFDEDDLVGKWPDKRRTSLRAMPGVRSFVDDDRLDEARWLRVPLDSFANFDQALQLCLEAAEYVNSPEGAPQRRRKRKKPM